MAEGILWWTMALPYWYSRYCSALVRPQRLKLTFLDAASRSEADGNRELVNQLQGLAMQLHSRDTPSRWWDGPCTFNLARFSDAGSVQADWRLLIAVTSHKQHNTQQQLTAFRDSLSRQSLQTNTKISRECLEGDLLDFYVFWTG